MTIENMSFDLLGLSASILPTLSELGYENASPIQQKSIPVLLEGGDLVAQAQTGTGKTAAFALPILTQLNLSVLKPQALVLAPTRELAIQVAESFQSYAKYMKGFHVLPIYGGQDYRGQLRSLQRGVHVVVGTPGRVMDHLRRGTLILDSIKTVVLDEADEMLKMGFIDDVKWILEQISGEHQTALFSATMPLSIARVAEQYLKNPTKIHIKSQTSTVATTEQFYTIVSQNNKLEALTRFLDVEDFDAAIIFARTKNATSEIATRLEARGYSAAAINGDMSQDLREKVIKRLKQGSLDVIVATDVAARGLDVERITHVINFDVPYDTEAYVHRIGRTGRAGRAGKALLFLTHREQRMLRYIERDTRQVITPIQPPSLSQVNAKRLENFTAQVLEVLSGTDLETSRELVQMIVHKSEHSELDVAAAMAFMLYKDKPVVAGSERQADTFSDRAPSRDDRRESRDSRDSRGSREPREPREPRARDEDMQRCRIDVGHTHGVTPGDIVGLIANKGDIHRKWIGRIDIYDQFTLVDIGREVVQQVMAAIGTCKLKRQDLNMVIDTGASRPAKPYPKKARDDRR
jgi:ATP-dependent RNA helicase DeaD